MDANNAQTPVLKEDLVPLEREVSLSESLIWRLQREFYAQRGLKAWTEDMVPHYITSNPYIAEIYARIIVGFLRDCMEAAENGPRTPSPRNPLRILELGAGPGKFSYLFLRCLKELLCAKNIPLEIVRYCMTDCSENLIDAWRTNRYLAEFVACGMLEFEVLQVGEEIKSKFIRNKDGEASNPASPLVLIANYVFDSLPQDAFVIQDGQILEALVTTRMPDASRREDTNAATAADLPEMRAEALSRLQLSFKNASPGPDRYPNPSWNAILEGYRSRLPAATVLFPSGVLETLQEIRSLSDDRLLVLAADKGYAHEDALMFSQGAPKLEFHASNCFSQMVNFDAIGKYFESMGGEALMPEKHFTSLNLCAFLRGQPGDLFPAASTAYREALGGFGPEDLFTLLGWLHAHMEEMSIAQILALLRLTNWDPVALMRLFPVITRQLRSVSIERNDLRSAVLKTCANHYPVTPGDNVLAFHCGIILSELRFFADAFSMFQTSQQIFGHSAPTSYNLGLCSLELGRPSEALAYMVEACNLDPAFEPAVVLRRKLEEENREE